MDHNKLFGGDRIDAASPFEPNTHTLREPWLVQAYRLLGEHVFKPAGYTVPTNVRVACSFPSRGGLARKRRRIGEAWSSEASADDTFEILISPNLDDVTEVLTTLAHEIVHVTVGIQCGHRGAFKRCALAIGLEAPMTVTPPGKAFLAAIAPIRDALGPYPHARLGLEYGSSIHTGPKPQKARLRKAQCSSCGLTLRITQTWIENSILCCPDSNCAGHFRPLLIS